MMTVVFVAADTLKLRSVVCVKVLKTLELTAGKTHQDIPRNEARQRATSVLTKTENKEHSTQSREHVCCYFRETKNKGTNIQEATTHKKGINAELWKKGRKRQEG